MGLNFVISDKDTEEFKEWMIEHNKICKKDAGAIGGRFTYSFTSTGLGDIIKIKCMCGEELDLTHSENW